MGWTLWAELIAQTGLLRNNYTLRIEQSVPKTKPLYSHKTVYKKRISHQLTLSNALKGHLRLGGDSSNFPTFLKIRKKNVGRRWKVSHPSREKVRNVSGKDRSLTRGLLLLFLGRNSRLTWSFCRCNKRRTTREAPGQRLLFWQYL